MRTRLDIGGGLGVLRDHLRTPLHIGGYTLLSNGAITSGLGFVYWTLAARLRPPETVGFEAALISAMLFLSGVAQLSFGSGLIRFVPVAGLESRRLILSAYGLSAGCAALLSTGFIAGIHIWSPALLALRDRPSWTIAFVLATSTWGVFALQDAVLTALRKTIWVAVENALYAATKIVLLVVLATAIPHGGIFVSWTLPAAATIGPVNWLILWRLLPTHAQESTRWNRLNSMQLARFTIANHTGTLLAMLAATGLPLLVLNVAGPVANAHFVTTWMVVLAIQSIPQSLTAPLPAEAVRDPLLLHLHMRRVTAHVFALVIPVALVVGLAAPYILLAFGSAYAADGAAVLRALALGTIPSALLTVAVSVARARNHSGVVVAVQGASCVLLLGLAVPGLLRFGLVGVGWAWLVSQTLVAMVLLMTYLRPSLLHGTSLQAA